MKKVLAVCVLVFSSLIMTFGQRPGGGWSEGGERPKIGTVLGVVKDSATGIPVEYANIALLRMKDSSLATGGVTNEKGEFFIEKVEVGMYFVRINFLGFAEKVISGIRVTPKEPKIDLGTIKLGKGDFSLDEVEVVAEKSMVEFNLDKKVFNVEKDLTTTGGSAIDVMKNIPSVSVDQDNNLNLRGSSNVNVLIDGKPSSISPSILLEQIPASQIERIELVTNPSAKYDPDGMAGIINIITKKGREPGYNGTISLNAGTNNKYSGNAAFNYKLKKINLFASYDGRYNEQWRTSKVDKEWLVNDTLFKQDQDGDQNSIRINHSVKTGFDWDLNKNNNITLTGNWRGGNDKRPEIIYYEQLDYLDHVTDVWVRDNNRTSEDSDWGGQLFYKHLFPQKGRELTVDGNFSTSVDNDDLDAVQEYSRLFDLNSDSLFRQYTGNRRANMIYSAQADYVHPSEKWGRIETGAKYSYRGSEFDLIRENYDVSQAVFIYDSLVSNSFLYDEHIFAGYAIYANKWNNLSYQAGVRAEQADISINQLTIDSIVKQNYFNWFPSAHIRYDLKKKGELSLSYSKRINRPSSWSLNPFPDYTDPLNLRAGNPYLRPEYVDSYEFGYMVYTKKAVFNVSLFHRQTNNAITRYRTVADDGVSLMTQLNLAKSTSSGSDFMVNLTLTPWWRMNINGGIFYSRLFGRDDLGIQGNENWNWNGKFSSNWTVYKKVDLQLSGFYNSGWITLQGEMAPMYSLEIGAKMDVLKKRGNINFRLSDIFDTRQHQFFTYTSTFDIDNTFKRESRIFYVGFMYKINGGNTRREKRNWEGGGGGDMDM